MSGPASVAIPLDRSAVVVGRGPRVLEAALCDCVAADADRVRDTPSLLAQPLRVIVPSRSLREHVTACLARHTGRALAGVQVQTLFGLAIEVVERAGEVPPVGDCLLPVWVRRAARRQATLRVALDDLVDGFSAVEAAIRDLLDAGFLPSLHEPLDERLVDWSQLTGDVSVPRALVAVAGDAVSQMRVEGAGHGSDLLRRAAELLEEGASLPSRGVVVHGFADATGVLLELLRALQRSGPAAVFLDEPPRPERADGAESGGRFGRRFREALCGGSEVERFDLPLDLAQNPETATSDIVCTLAMGAQAEARDVGMQIRDLLDDGVLPETISVVSRDLSPYVSALRVQFDRLGVPYSGVGAGGPGGTRTRRLAALLELLRGGVDCATDRWLDCLAHLDAGERADVRMALRHRGASRVRDVAAIESDRWLIPVRSSLGPAPSTGDHSSGEQDGDLEPDRLRSRRRHVPSETARRVSQRARDFARRRQAGERERTWDQHLADARSLLQESLGWREGAEGWPSVFAALDELSNQRPSGSGLPTEPSADSRTSGGEDQLPLSFEEPVAAHSKRDWLLSTDEFVLVLQRALERTASEPIGGNGGGVQILSVMEARARTCERLFVLGMNRDVFPRTVREDPMLPDAVRRPMAEILPDLAEKAVGHDEERFLFAQLVASSPHVALSWQAQDEEGKAQAASTLVERLRWHHPDAPVRHAAPLHGAASVEGGFEASALEHALAAGLYGDRSQFDAALGVAFAERKASLGGDGLALDAARVAAGRLAVLGEIDAGSTARSVLGPFFGFIGPAAEPDDPRGRDLYITRLEAIARCPWQAFVEQLLRVEPVPDPLAALPSVDARQIGSVTHDVLQSLTGAEASSPGMEEVVSRSPREMRWPGDAEVRNAVHEIGRRALEEEGLGLPGLVHVLEVLVWRHLEVARDLEWPTSDSVVHVFGAEVEGSCAVGADDRLVRFRADRVDATEHGPVLVDYKTGKPAVTAKKPDTRHEKLVQAIREGRLLQGVAYAKSVPNAQGRYLYLSPKHEAALASIGVDAENRDIAAAFDHCVATVLAALDLGALPPRLLDADRQKESGACKWCNVAEACVYGDSGARARMRDWLTAQDGKPLPEDSAERAALQVLRLNDPGQAQ